MKKVFFSLVIMMMSLTSAFAQGKPSTAVWNSPNGTVAEVLKLEYWLYIVGQEPTRLFNIACIDKQHKDGPECSALMPALDPGEYTVTLTAYDGKDESLHSTPVTFSVFKLIILKTPANFQIIEGIVR